MARLWETLSPGVKVRHVSATGVQLEGYVLVMVYDPTHNSVHLTRQGAKKAMSPEQVGTEFRWRWKREGCLYQGMTR